MGKIWFTSDLHFSHNQPFIYERRGFNNIKEHNEAIIKNFNEVVNWDDDLYILGDLFLNDNEEGMKCVRRLPGTLHIIWGNHDSDTRKDLLANEPRVIMHGYSDIFKYKNYHFYLSHYPTITANNDEDKPLKAKIINLYGHTHQQDNFYNSIPTMYHVGVDSHNLYPVEIEQIIEEIKNEYKKR